MEQKLKRNKLFLRLSVVTIFAVYLLIAVGGIVRTTGSGMGCPDWPKCFGAIVPPTDVSQLPEDYKAQYVQQRVEKNIKFSKYLSALGFETLADQVKNDPSILEEEDFNAVKTWTEYINRLVGAVIGVLIFATFLASLKFWKEKKLITVLSFVAVVLVGFQGWIGSIVVSTNLLQWMITIHMLLALALVCLLIYTYYISIPNKGDVNERLNKSTRYLIVVCLILTLVQIVLGTQVRESIDRVAEVFARTEWIANLGLDFKIHRSYSLLIMGLHIWLLVKLRSEAGSSPKLMFANRALLIIVGIEIVSGTTMAYFGVPAFIQPIHLLLGTGIIGLQYFILLLTNRNGKMIA